ncbi:MAG: hypothetical protein SP4CHLAM5_00520 [Chlamydiia bacterium]|nr:hypothetical protein [Chlamydiia bacterium]MCH9617929.1 hypothetical protein [Chlamydiia bacterium]MCH9624145.1 hypothetical protein [Chlamydiia bacterium]
MPYILYGDKLNQINDHYQAYLDYLHPALFAAAELFKKIGWCVILEREMRASI